MVWQYSDKVVYFDHVSHFPNKSLHYHPRHKRDPHLQKFELDLDSEIRKLNSDYDAKRNNDFILKNLKIIPAKEGVFYKWLKNNDRLGGQYKVPRLFNDNKIFLQILELNR